ncbi:MAG: nucleotide exchange factor GrpE, partial [Candidatus Methanomethylophilus sp.]|nr:nucleotide exchange factor GrpE [Methanomethylophilus sp.]
REEEVAMTAQTTLTEEKAEAAEPVKKPKEPNKKRVTNVETRAVMDTVLETASDLKEVQGRLTADIIGLSDKIDGFQDAMGVIINKIDDLQFSSPAEPTPAPEKREYLGGEAPEPAPPGSGDLGQYVTTREMFDKYARQMDRRDGELANKKFMHLMEKLSLMREDYAKLCRNLSENAASYSGKEVLTSFEAYLVDIENMLTDAGVTIGHFGSIGDPVDVQHQRIMGVVATDDPSKNGTVAQKLSEGYEYDGRAIVKEKVNVYKTAGQTPAVTETGFRLSPSQ